jgi:radical SAM protein with 4Fe4S-binding SPASM domain
MAYRLTKRRLKKALLRLRRLPGGFNLFRYAGNKVRGVLLSLVRSTRVPHPASIMLEVTNQCNLACITCPREYAFGHQMDKGFMDLDKMKRVVDEAFPYVDSIGLTGLGETFMYKKLPEIVSYIRSLNKGIIISVSTNSHLPVSREMVRQLADQIDTIQISIDGTEGIYEQVRLKGQYAFFLSNTRDAIEACRGKRASILFNFVAIRENYRQMADVVRLAGELGVRYMNITPFNVAAVTIHDRSYYEFFQTLEFRTELKRARAMAMTFPELELTTWDIESPKGFRKCDLVWSHFYISWDGYATPCCAKPFPKELNFGNVFEKGLMNCLNSSEYRAFRAAWYRNEAPDFCRNCHMIELDPVRTDDIPEPQPVNP